MKLLLRWLAPFLAWLSVAFVFASQLYLFASRGGVKMNLRDVLIWEVPRWCLWVFLAPIIRKLAGKYPLRKPKIVRLIVFHTFCGAVLSLIHLILFLVIFHQLRIMSGNKGSMIESFQLAFPLDFHVGIAVYWLILLLKQSSDSEKRVAQLQTELAHAQLQAIKMQLHPHFLFNTLNSISSYLRTDVEVADEMIGQLGDFLRLTLQNSGTHEIVLEKELEFLKRYLQIEQLRFQDRLDTQFEIESDTLSALVPNLILQPVVENAVQHGISMRSGIGKIRIATKRLNGQLQILISDNGPGLPPKIQEGIGITATRERLQQMYGVRGHLELSNQAEGGTVVTLGIPFHVSEKTV